MTDCCRLLGSVYVNDDFLGHQLSEVAACEDQLMFLLFVVAECHEEDYMGALSVRGGGGVR